MTASTDGHSSARRAREVPRSAEEVANHPAVEAGARAGYAVNGLLHLLIAVLGLEVAFGHKGAQADPSGALQLVAGTPVGGVVLVAVVVSFALLAVWQFAEAFRSRQTSDRVKAVAKAVTYLVLGWGAVSVLIGSSTSSSTSATHATATLLGLPFGVALVVVAGLAVVGIGAYHVHKGWTEGFRKDLRSSPSRPVVIAGRVGYVAKGIALIAVGAGLVTAALRHDPAESRGLDGALSDLVSLPFGQVIVVVISLGFAAYGVYSFSRARRAKV